MIARRRPLLPALLALALASGTTAAQTPAPPDATARPRNVILMIPDGCGP
jgi:alkaline phosphatase